MKNELVNKGNVEKIVDKMLPGLGGKIQNKFKNVFLTNLKDHEMSKLSVYAEKIEKAIVTVEKKKGKPPTNLPDIVNNIYDCVKAGYHPRDVYIYPYGDKIDVMVDYKGIVKNIKETNTIGIIDIDVDVFRDDDVLNVDSKGIWTIDKQSKANPFSETGKPLGILITYWGKGRELISQSKYDYEVRSKVSKGSSKSPTSPAWTKHPEAMVIRSALKRSMDFIPTEDIEEARAHRRLMKYELETHGKINLNKEDAVVVKEENKELPHQDIADFIEADIEKNK